MHIIHPCDAFAKRTGYTSWTAALEAMKAGQIISGSAPQVGKSIMELKMFHDQARSDGLVVVPVPHCDFGSVSVGLYANFPEHTRKRIDTEADTVVSLGGRYRTASDV